MLRYILALALLMALPALADDLVMRERDQAIRLHDKPCHSLAVAALVPEQYRAALRAMTAILNGQSFEGCWIAVGNAAYLIYDDGDQGAARLADFKVERSI
ncbi:MAG: hypothetical protein V4669_13530 [Pseudomonadota bacterium]